MRLHRHLNISRRACTLSEIEGSPLDALRMSLNVARDPSSRDPERVEGLGVNGTTQNDQMHSWLYLDNGRFGFGVEEVRLAHIEHEVDILVDLRPVMRSDPSDERVLSDLHVEVDL